MEKAYKSIRVFRSPILERLTHVHPLTPLVLWTPIVLLLLWRSLVIDELKVIPVFSLSFIGFFLWSLTEYAVHRFIFHLEGQSTLGRRIHYLIHGIHHADPMDPTRLVMPPVMSLSLGFIFYFGFRFILGPVWVQPFFAFFLIGYLCYDYIHFAVHHFNPRTRVGKALKQSHMQHHYVDPNSRWGVSSPFWDFVFGTADAESVKDKERVI